MPESTRRDNVRLALITSGMGAGPLYNFGLSATSALVIANFAISPSQFGAVLTTVFASAAVASTFLGWLADRLPMRAQFSVLFGGAALSLAVAALAPSFAFLLLTAVFSGLSQAMSNPATNRAILALAPPAKRTGWIGVKQSGVQASQLVAGLSFPALAILLGWPGAAVVLSLVCLALLVATFVVLPSRAAAAAAKAPTASVPVTDRANPLTGRQIWTIVVLLAVVSFLSGFGLMATNTYLALFAVQEFGFSLVLGGVLVAAAGFIGVASRVWWGRRLARGSRAGTLLIVMSVGAVGAAGVLLLAGAVHAPALLWVAVALHGVTVLGANVVVNASVVKVAGGTRLGSATGVTAAGMYSGFATGPIVTGLIVDSPAGFTAGWLVVAAAYVACLVVSIGYAMVTARYRRG